MTDAKFTRDSAWVLRLLWLIVAGLAVGVLIVRGDGLLTESQLVRAGFANSAASAFAVPLAPGRAAHSLDTIRWGNHDPVLLAPGTKVSVPAASTLTITGWAFDLPAGTAFAAIGGRLEGSAQTSSAIVHLSRPDVALALHRPRARESGFVIQIDTTGVALGRHIIDLRALPAGGRTAYALDPSIAIDVTDKRAAAQHTDSIDAINGIIVAAPTSATAPVGIMRSAGRLTIAGWGFVTDGRHLASTITLLVDGSPIANARYGLARPDVARAFHDVRLTRSGFEGLLPLESLTPGRHEIKFQIGLSDGSTVPSYSTLYVNLL